MNFEVLKPLSTKSDKYSLACEIHWKLFFTSEKLMFSRKNGFFLIVCLYREQKKASPNTQCP